MSRISGFDIDELLKALYGPDFKAQDQPEPDLSLYLAQACASVSEASPDLALAIYFQV